MTRRTNKDSRRLSRREFLRDAGLAVGGATLGSISLLSACHRTINPMITPDFTATATRTVTTTSPPNTVTATVVPQTGKITLMNPLGYPPLVEQKPMAERPASLSGKKVYLVDVTFDDGDIFLKEMQAWFTRNMPQVTPEFRTKKGLYSSNDPGLWQEIKGSGGVMVMAIGH